jgi:hypothetical protein
LADYGGGFLMGGSARYAANEAFQPHPVTTTDNGVFGTSQGTIHLVLGSGGTNGNPDLLRFTPGR